MICDLSGKEERLCEHRTKIKWLIHCTCICFIKSFSFLTPGELKYFIQEVVWDTLKQAPCLQQLLPDWVCPGSKLGTLL